VVTDFDCCISDHDAVTVQDIIRVLNSKRREGEGSGCTPAPDFPRSMNRALLFGPGRSTLR